MEEQKLNFHDYDIQLRKVKEKKNKKYTNSYTTRDIFYIIYILEATPVLIFTTVEWYNI